MASKSDTGNPMQSAIDEWILLYLFIGSSSNISIDFSTFHTGMKNVPGFVSYDQQMFYHSIQKRIDTLLEEEYIHSTAPDKKDTLVLSDTGREKAESIYNSLSDSQKKTLEMMVLQDKDKNLMNFLIYNYSKDPSFMVMW